MFFSGEHLQRFDGVTLVILSYWHGTQKEPADKYSEECIDIWWHKIIWGDDSLVNVVLVEVQMFNEIFLCNQR